jgi:sialate O-acetylesterase
LITILGLSTGNACAEVRLPRILSDHMVLQAGQDVPVWGTADPGEQVTVTLAGQTRRASADAQGRWRVSLDLAKVPAQTLTMSVRGASTSLTVTDILVGEAWLASGQSNMEKPMRGQRGQKDVFDADKEVAAANYPRLRLFKVKKASTATRAADVDGEWVACTPDSLDGTRFSAAAYYFGRRVQAATGRAVGLIDATWGGTRIETWTAPEGFAAVPSLARFAGAAPDSRVDGGDIAMRYHGMVEPLAPFALRGVIWYQGESNTEFTAEGQYAEKMRALIQGWRQVFGHDLSFYYVQTAPHLYHVHRPETVTSPEAAPRLWEAQADAQAIAGTGMVVTTDLVDDLFDIHPRNKKDVGERLAGLALARDYGQHGLMVMGPRFKRMAIGEGCIRVEFDGAEGGLKARDGKPLSWFTLAGIDGIYYPAKAVVDGNGIVVTSARVPAPVSIHFGWDEAAQPNLVNAAGLPAQPFRAPREPARSGRD